MRIDRYITILAFCIIILIPIFLFVGSQISPGIEEISTAGRNPFFVNPNEVNESEWGNLDFSDGSIQNHVTATMENAIPYREESMMAKAELQRAFISASNSLFGWDCYPTYFGSWHTYYPQYDALDVIPYYSRNGMIREITDFAESLDMLASEYADRHFVLYLADHSLTSPFNPSLNLVTSHITTAEVCTIIESQLHSENISILHDEYDSAEQYYDHYYRSDHHWRSEGAFAAYEAIMESLGREALEAGDFDRVAGPTFIGSYARLGLKEIEDDPYEIDYDFSSVLLLGAGLEEQGNAHRDYFIADYMMQQWDFYDLFYRYYQEATGTGTANAVLVCDSYGYPVIRLLGATYNNILCSKAFRSVDHTTDWISGLIETNNAEDIILIASPADIAKAKGRNPLLLDTPTDPQEESS